MDEASSPEQEQQDQPMSRATDPNVAAYPFSNGGPVGQGFTPTAAPEERAITTKSIHESLATKHVCPFCGSQNAVLAGSNGTAAAPCPRCTMEDTAATRQATKARIGPWH